MENRRTFLTVTSVSATAGLAGCSDFNFMTQDGENTDNGVSGPLTIQVQPDQEQLVTLQEELQTEIEAGETTETEAEEELGARRTELTEEAVDTFEETASNDESISVENSESEHGILRVNAPPETLIDHLQNGEIGGILPDAYYDQYLQQQQRLERQQKLQEQIANQQENANETNGSSETENESSE